MCDAPWQPAGLIHEQRFQFYCENCGDSFQLDDFLKLLEHHALFF